ncbi:MAG: anion transporter [Candidatus Hydrogenedentes bacterium]|nr:anion transporter [Candidatus Hydrogenedentota bacterium]
MSEGDVSHSLVLAIFVFVYGGMMLGGVPGLVLDRTGVALLGAIALLVFQQMNPADAWLAIDVPTMALLFGLMMVSAQLRLGGFYARVTRELVAADWPPQVLLGAVIAAAGLLSAVLANDIVCLAMTPVLIDLCRRKGLQPVPFLIGLACAANVGSAATLIGNPQNILIGQTMHLSFTSYLWDAGPPALAGLALVWGIVALQFRESWHCHAVHRRSELRAFDSWQTGKGLVILTLLMLVFVLTDWPRDVAAVLAAGILLLSRRMATREMLGMVDWPLLVLFAGLFVVNAAMARTGMLDQAFSTMRSAGIAVEHPPILFGVTVALSNLVSNVPATMLLLPLATGPLDGAVLALASTLAGNLIIVGSIANIIVIEQAALEGIKIGWKMHARTGIPVTLATLALAGLWLWLRFAATG